MGDENLNISCDEPAPACSLSGIDTFPVIELYLDQVLGLVESELGPFAKPGAKLITGSMVNNYVKHRLIPMPQRKRYTRRHVALLVIVCFFKQVYSMAEVKRLIELAEAAGLADESGYNEFANLVNGSYRACWERVHKASCLGKTEPHPVPKDIDTGSQAYAIFSAAISSVCEQAVVERILDAE